MSATAERIEVLGVPVDRITMEQTLDEIAPLLEGDRCEQVFAINPEKIVKARRDPVLLERLRSARILIPDGIGVIHAARMLGLGRMVQVCGSDLMPALCQRASRNGHGVFLFGASEEVNRLAREKLPSLYPGLRVLGGATARVASDGSIPDDPGADDPGAGAPGAGAEQRCIDAINASGADILFVALGSPKQEFFVGRVRERLKVKVCVGVGGTFDFIAGRVARAPAVMRRLHLEWFYRLLREPRRIGRQRACADFALQVLREMRSRRA